jgi:DNA-binding MarR family transcriptional regulator
VEKTSTPVATRGRSTAPDADRAADLGVAPGHLARARPVFSTVLPVADRWLDEDQQRAWRAWLTASELVPRALDAQLQRDAGISHAAYVVLAMLSESPTRSRRMSDLARRANQSQSRLSHTVARLEERGWVRRQRAAEDGRGSTAVLTDAGWDVVVAVAPGHVEAVREAVFGPLTPEQTRVLGEALQVVVDKLDPDRSLRVEHGTDTED